MLLGGETPAESYSPTSNGNTSAPDNENSINGSSENNNSTSPTTLEPSLNNINLLQSNQIPSQQQQHMTEDYSNKISTKDNNQNFLPENNLDMYQDLRSSQTSTHISPRVQPYDLNIAHQQAHHHHLRSSNHMNQQQYANGNNGRKIPSPYKNLSLLNHQSALTYADNGNDMMVLKEEPY
jgi:hypothetical protein